MGSNDTPPPHVPAHVVPVAALLLQAGGALWTLSYVLYLRESLASRSYGMPMFALALNLGWELVFAWLVSETAVEKTVFGVWCLVDVGLVYGLVRYGPREWERQSAFVARHVGGVFAGMLALAVWMNWAFARWWITELVVVREGKFYRGVEGPDTTELGWWTSAALQVHLSVASLVMLVVRGHSGGVNWGIWATRFLGSIVGLWVNFFWCWYHWPEAHPYVTYDVSVVMIVVSLVCDVVYASVLWIVRKTETTLPDGSKVAGEYFAGSKMKSS